MFDSPQRSKHNFSLQSVLDWTHPAFYGRVNPYQYFFEGILSASWHRFQDDEGPNSFVSSQDGV